MPDPAPTPADAPPRPKKRGFFRRFLRWFGIFLLVVIIFHRPLFHATVRFALRTVAARMHIELDLRTSGTIFTNLSIENVKARATGAGPTPIKLIDIQRVRLDYSLPDLVKYGVGELIHSYEIHQATLELEAMPSKDKEERKEKVRIAKLLNDILGQPAAYSDKVNIQNFSITVRAPNNVTEVLGVDLFLHPEQAGYFRVKKLAIPGVPKWENLSATTSYENRNLFFKDLYLAPQLVINQLNFDASQRAQKKGSMMLKAQAFGGTLELNLSGAVLEKKGENLENSYLTILKVAAANVSLEEATAYFGAPKPPVAKLAALNIDFTGEPELPQTWDGSLGARVETIAAGPAKLDAFELAAGFHEGRANLHTVNLSAGKNKVGLQVVVDLPASVNEFNKADLAATLKIDAPELATLTAMLPDPFVGELTGGGQVTVRSGLLKAELAIDTPGLASKAVNLGKTSLALKASRQIDPPPEAPFATLDAQVSGEVNEIRVQTFTIDSVKLDAVVDKEVATLRLAEVRRGENFVTASGTAQLPRDPKDFARTPIDAQFAIQVPNLGSFGIAAAGQTLQGKIEGGGTMKMINGQLQGGVKIDGSAFTLGPFAARQLAIKVGVANNEAVIDQLAFLIDDSNQIVASGKGGIAAPFAYEGGLLISLNSLANLKPLLNLFGVKQDVAGALSFGWQGKGQAQPQSHLGELDIKLDKGRFDKIDLREISFGGQYGPGYAESKTFKFVTGATSLQGMIEFRENRLRIKDLDLDQAGNQVLTGFAFIPFDPSNLKQPVPLDQRIAVNINTVKLDLDKLLASFGQQSPVSGAITAQIVAGGTSLQPFAHLKVNGEALQSKQVKQVEPANLVLDAHYSKKELTLDVTVKQPQIQPLTVKGKAPFDLETTVQTGKFDPALPIDVSVNLPASSLAFVPKLAPPVRRIEGTAAINIHATGPMNKPNIAGKVDIDLKGARMVDENIPAIGAFKAVLAFAENTLKFQTFEGEVGGGKFKLGGNINLANIADPVFALRLESDEVLVKRDDSITVRADTDIKLDGPLKAATVGGTVYVVHSRFFKEIDILPIALPGKPKPAAPKTAKAGPTAISIPQPPLRDWKFDLAIKTRENDPFLIRGNLANGAASVNLKLGGTGLAPYLEGTVNIEKFTASLPFSSLSITSGFIAFNKDSPFVPSLELQAESRIRDYVVHAFIYGKSTDPQVSFSSEPPLAHADIVSLLATGTTTAELTGSADALASRAAMLAIQQLYQKMFKKNAPPPEKTDSGSLMDRFQIELGSVDNRSSRQEVSARFKVNDQIYLLGDIGVDGNFTGSLKYLLRFR